MSLIVLVVNDKRYLINEDSKASEKHCQEIIDSHGADAVVEFDKVKPSDVKRKTLKDLIN